MLYGVFQGIDYFLQILRYILLAYIILSWVAQPRSRVRMFVNRIVDPLLSPIRNILYRFFPYSRIDFASLVGFLLLELLQVLLWRIFRLII